TELEYGPTGLSDGAHGELSAAPAYGDLAKGAHGTFIKMPAGYVSPTHTHTDDYWAVVVSGVMVNKTPDGRDVPLPIGSYYFQKGGEPTSPSASRRPNASSSSVRMASSTTTSEAHRNDTRRTSAAGADRSLPVWSPRALRCTHRPYGFN